MVLVPRSEASGAGGEISELEAADDAHYITYDVYTLIIVEPPPPVDARPVWNGPGTYAEANNSVKRLQVLQRVVPAYILAAGGTIMYVMLRDENRPDQDPDPTHRLVMMGMTVVGGCACCCGTAGMAMYGLCSMQHDDSVYASLPGFRDWNNDHYQEPGPAAPADP